MRKRRGERDPEATGVLIRAWRWLRSSGYSEDEQPRSGHGQQQAQAEERLRRAAGTQLTFWKLNR